MFDKDTNIKESFNNSNNIKQAGRDIKETIFNFFNFTNNDEKLIRENEQLKQKLELVLESLFGSSYEFFNKTNRELTLFFNELLDGQTLHQKLETLEEEQNKREKLFVELEKEKANAKPKFKDVLEEAEQYLLNFQYEKYHSVFEKYRNEVLKESVKEYGRTFYLEGEEYLSRFKYEKALEMYEKANHFDENNSLYLNQIGMSYFGYANETALKYFELALEHMEQFDEDTTRYLNNIGSALKELGDYKEALIYQKQALALLKQLNKEDKDIIFAYHQIGTTYRWLKDYKRAIAYSRKSLKLSKAIKEEDEEYFSKIAVIYNNLANICQDLENTDKAFEYYNKALEIDYKALGENNLQTANHLNNLGVCYSKEKNYPKAREYYKNAFDIVSLILPKDHDTFIKIQDNLESIKNK
jgi:tetratricopeptide (TPR) repeat protein